MNRSSDSEVRLLPHLGRDDDHLTMDGIDLVELAEREGTALFVFSERRLRDNAAGFLAAARAGHPRAVVCYASKACSNVHVLRILRSEGLAIEVNSGGEIYKAQAAGFSPAEMVFNGVAKSAEELAAAIDLGIKAINVNSVFELRRIGDLARARRRRAAVSLRLVPGVAGGATPGIQTGSESSKFGMTEAELEDALGAIEGSGDAIEVVGLHVHIGSQVAELDAYRQAVAFAAGAGAPAELQARPPARPCQSRRRLSHSLCARPGRPQRDRPFRCTDGRGGDGEGGGGTSRRGHRHRDRDTFRAWPGDRRRRCRAAFAGGKRKTPGQPNAGSISMPATICCSMPPRCAGTITW